MNAHLHVDAIDAEVLHCFGLSLKDAGFDPDRLFHTYSDLSSRDAALEAGSDYSLDRVDLGWR